MFSLEKFQNFITFTNVITILYNVINQSCLWLSESYQSFFLNMNELSFHQAVRYPFFLAEFLNYNNKNTQHRNLHRKPHFFRQTVMIGHCCPRSFRNSLHCPPDDFQHLLLFLLFGFDRLQKSKHPYISG